MDDDNLIFEIFQQIETLEEFDKVCGSFNFLLRLEILNESKFLRMVATKTFRKLNNLNYGT